VPHPVGNDRPAACPAIVPAGGGAEGTRHSNAGHKSSSPAGSWIHPNDRAKLRLTVPAAVPAPETPAMEPAAAKSAPMAEAAAVSIAVPKTIPATDKYDSRIKPVPTPRVGVIVIVNRGRRRVNR
jgi:hypothetical protein